MTAEPSAQLPDILPADHDPWTKVYITACSQAIYEENKLLVVRKSAFFRSTLPVLPLLLVLSPVNSSSCAMENKTTEIRVKYENILIHDINELVNISAQNRDRCCKNKNTKVFFCNDTQEIESLQSMACNMLRFFHKQRISKTFRWKAAFVSCGTLQVLKCKCEGHRKEKICSHVNVFSKEDTETGEQSRKKCNQEVCELKENISSLRSCWNKFEKIISR